jgi:4-hydroxybenzoate polyprenyltransferase
MAEAGDGAVSRSASPAQERREGQVYSSDSLAARYASFVKLPHTLFALPFAGVGAVLASYRHADRITAWTLLLTLVAFTAARFAAMGFNRIVDRRLDALNPRTRARELPAGRLTLLQARAAVVGAAAIFMAAAWLLNPLCGLLTPVALAWIFFYSYTKRFTSFSHVVLGLALGIAPAGAYIAIAGVWPDPWWALPLLSAAVMFWVAGFDIIYALQDEAFDRTHGLFSVPARLGTRGALVAARSLHGASVGAFLALGWLGAFPLGPAFFAGVAMMTVLLIYEHAVVRSAGEGKLDLTRVDQAFFRANVAVSVSLLLFTLIDRLLFTAARAGG